MPNDEFSLDWIENHEYRIGKLETWKDNHEEAISSQIKENTEMHFTIEQLKKDTAKQEAHMNKQDEKLDKMGSNIHKMILGIAGTIILTLLKIVIDLTLLKGK